MGVSVGQQVENHSRPAGIAAPTATKEKGTKYLGNGIMQCARTDYTGEKVVPETLNLHVLAAYQPKKHKDIGTHGKLDENSGVGLPGIR